MTLKLKDKKAIVAEVASAAANALSAAAADYRGLTVEEMTQLRAKARVAGVYLRVVRNTLAKRALQETDFACFDEILRGPLFLAFSNEDPGAAARLLRDFAKNHENLQIKALSISGRLLGPESLEVIANLPTREQALALLAAVMKAPIEKFVRTLAEPYTQLVRCIAAVKDKK